MQLTAAVLQEVLLVVGLRQRGRGGVANLLRRRRGERTALGASRRGVPTMSVAPRHLREGSARQLVLALTGVKTRKPFVHPRGLLIIVLVSCSKDFKYPLGVNLFARAPPAVLAPPSLTFCSTVMRCQ